MYTIFKTPEGERRFHDAYSKILSVWPVPYDTLDISTRFGTTHVIACGKPDAPPLLLLHGMTANSTMWKDNIADLSGRYRTYAVDVMGDFGKSVVTKPLQSPEDCNLWLNDVLDGLRLGRTHVLGHSMGGWLALNFALHAPRKVNRLILLAPVGAFYSIPLQFMFKVYPALLLPSPRRIERAWNWFLAKGNRLDELAMGQAVEAYTHCRMLLKVIPKRFAQEQLQQLAVPTLFLVGEEEVIYNARKAAKLVRRLIPTAETEIVPRASHCLNAEQAEIVNGRILRFLHQ